MGELPEDKYKEFWERYMEVEHLELEQRRSGQLSRALGRALPGESQDELDRIAKEDQRLAEEGLVELRRGDRQGRIDSENARAAWIKARLDSIHRPR